MYRIGSIFAPTLPRILLTTVFLLLSFAGLPLCAYSAEVTTIYFYNPEISTTRSVVLKSTFDQYLKEQGNYQFQPVHNKKTFEGLISNNHKATFIMSSWHFRQLGDKTHTLVSALRGIKNKSDTYRKILVSKRSNINPETMTIATSGTIEYSLSTLSSIYPNRSPESLSNLNILIVPKDIDALMAVGFDLADAALTTKLSLKKLSTLYKNQHQQLNILGESLPLKRLVVIHPPENTETIDALKRMSQSKKGQQGLHMLGLDDWQVINTAQATDRRSQK